MKNLVFSYNGRGKLKQGTDDLVRMHAAGVFDQTRITGRQKGRSGAFGRVGTGVVGIVDDHMAGSTRR